MSGADPSRRRAAVAGRFYPQDPQELRETVDDCLRGVPRESRRVVAAIVPHAGLMFSGKCAGVVLGRLAFPRIVVILAPNHSGHWHDPGGAIWQSGVFETPLGDVQIDETFATHLTSRCPLVRHDPSAHLFEHAVEVELPFLQVLAEKSRIVPIVLAWDDWVKAEQLGAALATACSAAPNDVLLLASSDMTHYESARSARRKDEMALAAIGRLDGRALLDVCARERISMCGRVPAAVVLEASRRLGATRAELLDYRHSGMVDGDESHVVSYAGVAIS